jgi:hypothetical protein
MDKQQLQLQIAQALLQLGIDCEQNKESDLAIHKELVSAGWSTGTMKIRYDAFIRLDEAGKKVLMWQKTAEVRSGVSLSGGFEASSQSGATVFRKVKIVQYGPEGKAVEANLDLGEIVKAVQDAAKQNGWKFHTVLLQGKARY